MLEQLGFFGAVSFLRQRGDIVLLIPLAKNCIMGLRRIEQKSNPDGSSFREAKKKRVGEQEKKEERVCERRFRLLR